MRSQTWIEVLSLNNQASNLSVQSGISAKPRILWSRSFAGTESSSAHEKTGSGLTATPSNDDHKSPMAATNDWKTSRFFSTITQLAKPNSQSAEKTTLATFFVPTSVILPTTKFEKVSLKTTTDFDAKGPQVKTSIWKLKIDRYFLLHKLTSRTVRAEIIIWHFSSIYCPVQIETIIWPNLKKVFGPWWWHSGQLLCLLLWRSKFESRSLLTEFLCA